MGGLTAERRAAREEIRLEAGRRFARGDRSLDIVKDLRVRERSVERWRRNWREGGMEGLMSKAGVARTVRSPRRSHPSSGRGCCTAMAGPLPDLASGTF
ncbi:helix-turn-helix domain-containing protein [Streptomyces sp. NPDC048508]|uniref:helix-turn-helix domain-containing protein n=1 Tax=Streptomyces sp. NPDC048508 TaxID=3365561 RepID=UPI0037137DEE